MSTQAAPSAALALDLALALDPSTIMLAAGLAPDLWQAELLRLRPQQAALLCTRQAGKSTTTAAVATIEAVQHAPALILLLSPSLRQSQELFRKVVEFYNAIGAPVPIKEQSALRLELVNGSRIIALPGKEATIRGFSGAALLILDEASRVEDDLYFAVRPMLAVSGGRIIMLSTPFGKRGAFFEVWENGGANWHRVKVTANDCPRISKEFLESERAALGEWFFQQEYMCEFKDTTDSVFGYETVMAAMNDSIAPLHLDGLGVSIL
jgi:hypothetical protein